MADEIRPTPRNPLFGLFSDFVNVPLDYMSDPRRTQQMQGIASFIRGTGVPSTLENLSYDPSGRGLFTGAGGLGGTTRMRPEAIEAALTLAPGVGPAARLTRGLPVGASIRDVGSKLKVKPPTDDVYEVMDATFDYGKLGGNKNLPIDQLIGGVRMSDPTEAKRVKELAAKISSDNGYISRIIVDDQGNVLEGQHRLEALRLLGEKNVPVAIIEDLSNKYNIPAMRKSLEGQLRSDNVGQMVKRAIDAIEESGSVDKALTDFAMPAQFQKPFEDALRASIKTQPTLQQASPVYTDPFANTIADTTR